MTCAGYELLDVLKTLLTVLWSGIYSGWLGAVGSAFVFVVLFEGRIFYVLPCSPLASEGLVVSFRRVMLATFCQSWCRRLFESQFCHNIPSLINHQSLWRLRFQSFLLGCIHHVPPFGDVPVASVGLQMVCWEMGNCYAIPYWSFGITRA